MDKAIMGHMLKSFLGTMRAPKPVIEAVDLLARVNWTMPNKTTGLDLQLAEKDLASSNAFHVFGNLEGKPIAIYVVADDSIPIAAGLMDLLSEMGKGEKIATQL
jgi:hypothetical protein